MKIALISDGIYPYVIGGMQKHSSSIGVELVKLGYSVDLCHFVLKGSSIPTTDEVNRFHFNSTNFKFSSSKVGTLKSVMMTSSS